jgi:hypothetical protein
MEGSFGRSVLGFPGVFSGSPPENTKEVTPLILNPNNQLRSWVVSCNAQNETYTNIDANIGGMR